MCQRLHRFDSWELKTSTKSLNRFEKMCLMIGNKGVMGIPRVY